jgi:uncharacterized membrane protein
LPLRREKGGKKVEPIQQKEKDLSGDPTKNGKAKCSLVLGIVGLIFSLLIAIVGIIIGIIGVVLANAGKKSEKKNLAQTGFVLNVLAIVFGVINAFLGAVLYTMHS